MNRGGGGCAARDTDEYGREMSVYVMETVSTRSGRSLQVSVGDTKEASVKRRLRCLRTSIFCMNARS